MKTRFDARSPGRGRRLARLLCLCVWLAVPAVSAGCGDLEDDEALYEAVRDINPEADIAGEEQALETPPEGYIPDNARDDQVAAIERANWFRFHSDLPPLDMLAPINEAAQAHCDYYVTHHDKYMSSGLSPHNENQGWAEGFVGESPGDRMAHFGYQAMGWGEVIAFVRNPKQAVDGWMNTLYHRIPFMNASYTACGYGQAGSGGWQNSTKIDTMDFGTAGWEGRTYSGPVLEGIYPPPGSSGIPPSFDGMESPQPPPPPNGYPSGTIVSVTWSAMANFQVEEHRIWEEGGNDLPHVWLDATNDNHLAGANTIALYAHSPLAKGTTYWVKIKGKKNGAEWERTWWFVTQRY